MRVRIPTLKINRPLVGLDVRDDGMLEAPRRFADVGWWQDGPMPGSEGAGVLVGHVDSVDGPAVFARLAELGEGERIAVERADGSTVTFAVRGSEWFAKARFPAARVYREGGPPGLVLITCGGDFDRSTGHYRDNLVVFADLVPESSARSRSRSERSANTPPAEPAEPANRSSTTREQAAR